MNKINRRRSVSHAVAETLESRRMLHTPELGAIGTQSVPAGKTLQIPVIGFDPEGGRLTYSVTRSSGSGLSPAFHASTNPWIEMNVAGKGTMTFELFADAAPKTVDRIKALVETGFYDGLTFHRIIDNFVAQGGDPEGNGSGGTDSQFDDEFNLSTVFSGTGQLAMANSGKDTNGSQFFITDGAQRALDFNHTIFGQLVRGFDVFNSILATNTNTSGTPATAPVISTVRVVSNTADGVLQIRGGSSTRSGDTVTVTVTNPENISTSRTFTVNTIADDTNDPPILDAPQSVYYASTGASVVIPVTASDPENDDYDVTGQFITQSGATGAVDQTAKTVTVTGGSTAGAVTLKVGVRAVGAVSRGSTVYQPGQNDSIVVYDTQTVTIVFGDSPLTTTTRDIHAHAGTAISNGLVATIADQRSGRTAGNLTARINWGDGTTTTGTVVANGSGKFNVLGTHTYEREASVPLSVTVTATQGATSTGDNRAESNPTSKLVGSKLFVFGTDFGSDNVGLSVSNNQLRANVNGVIKKYAPGSIGITEVYGYSGNDTLSVGNNIGGARIYGGDGDDNISAGNADDEVYGEAGNDYMFGNDGDDVMYGGDGDDTITAGAGKNSLYGENGEDRLNGSGGRDYLNGGGDGDRIYGRGGNDTLIGGSGVDRLFGEAGDDSLIGDQSPDKLYGGDGNDTLYGNAGNDILNGDAGTDTAYRDAGDIVDSIEVVVNV